MSHFTIVFSIIDLNVVPLMSQPLCVNLNPIVVLALLQKMGVQSSDVDDVTERRNYLMIHAWTLALCKHAAGVCGQLRSQLIRRNLRVGLLNNGVECRLLVSFGKWARILVHVILAYSSDLRAVRDISSLLFSQQTCSLCWLTLKIYFNYFDFYLDSTLNSQLLWYPRGSSNSKLLLFVQRFAWNPLQD